MRFILAPFLAIFFLPNCDATVGDSRYYDLDETFLIDGDHGGLMQTVQLTTCTATGCGACTATLMSPKSILTAAHCVTEPGAAIVSGSIRIPANRGTARPERVDIDVSEIHVAPGFPESAVLTSTVYDVAVVGLAGSAELPINTTPWVRMPKKRPADESHMWVNGQMLDGEFAANATRAVVKLAPLSPSDPRYPFQLLDWATISGEFVIDGGDSGGPLFLETTGEANDGGGGATRPTIYGVVSRRASFARLDPIVWWIDAARAAVEHEVTRCDNDVEQGEVVCAFQGDDTAYRCVNPGGVSAPNVANSQWESISCTGDSVCMENGAGSSWCLTPNSCRSFDRDVTACDAALGDCAFYACTEECHPRGTTGVCN